MRKVVGTIYISKEKIRKMRKKMSEQEVRDYHDKVKKSAHKHKSAKDYNRKNRRNEEEEIW